MKRTTALLAALLLVTSVVPAPVAAQDSNDTASVLDGVLDVDADDVVSSIVGWANGIADRAQNFWSARSDYQPPAEHAADLKATFNENSGTIQSYVNERTDASTDADVLEITLTEDDEDSATVDLVADVNGSNYENASIVDSTDRAVDETCELDGAAARNAADELQTFADEFASPNENVSVTFKSRLTTTYAGKVSCSFL